MGISALLSFLEKELPGKYQINAPMERYTTFRVGGPADLLVEPESQEEVCQLLREIHTQKVPLTVIGNGSNLLVMDKGIRGCVVKLGSSLKQLILDGCTIWWRQGCSCPGWLQRRLKEDWRDWNSLPGSLAAWEALSS